MTWNDPWEIGNKANPATASAFCLERVPRPHYRAGGPRQIPEDSLSCKDGAESPHRARSQTQVLSHVLLPSCAAFRCGFRFRGKFCFHVIPSLPPDRWPVGGGHAGTPGCNTTKKTREENLWETYALKRDFLRPERVFIEKFYRN